ncbi:MAG: hypothetical protein PHP37_00700 [Patescibacteria group bacterium]|nr:hypothetical protein [Patescibacteria group bacterium]
MKKFFGILFVFVFFVPIFLMAQETTPSRSISSLPIEMKSFVGNIEIENKTILKDLVLRESPAYQENYLSGNFGTIRNRIEFSNIVNKSTAQFTFVSRVVKIGDVYQLATAPTTTCASSDSALLYSSILKDVKAKKLLVQAEFTNPFTGERVKKLLEINFDQNSEPDGDDILARATITSADLGLNVLTLKVESPVGFTFSLQNKQWNVNMVIKANDKGNLEFLAPAMMPDGVYDFICRLGLPNGISGEERVTAFISKGEVILEKSSFNPLAFADEGKATFSGKRTLVKMRNTRNEDVTVFIPDEYIAKGRKTEVDLRTDAFEGVTWKSYNIAPGKTLKLRLKESSIPTIVYGNKFKETKILYLPIGSKNVYGVNLRRDRWESR